MSGASMRGTKAFAVLAGIGLVLAVFLAAAPRVYAELFMLCGQLHCDVNPPPADPKAFRARPGTAAGTVVDGYWRVEKIAPDTWAIGEPQDDPDNYEYLLVGQDRALLIDAGSTTTHDIHRAISPITTLPVTVIPSHLHFDHTNGLKFFRSIALIDLPETRGRARSGVVHLGRYQYLGWSPTSFRVTQWIEPGQWIDLGGRKVQVLSTPGHTTNSVSIWEPEARRLFTGDLAYPTSLYAFLPDSSLSTYVATLDRLSATLPSDTRIYGAHCCRNDAPPEAPWLSMADLRDARSAMQNVRDGKAAGRGFIIRRFPVNARMTMLTLFPFGNR